MATLYQIDEAFNANFRQRSGPGQRAKVETLGQGNYRATYDGEKTEFPVREGATEMQLPGITRDPAMRLWEVVKKKRG
ncbi:MAG TPA: hypothetical protein VGD37_08560 [Kofleriaceae bacterium]|jgi:hypothetical protein